MQTLRLMRIRSVDACGEPFACAVGARSCETGKDASFHPHLAPQAGLRATCPEDPIRDGAQALVHAQRVVELVGANNAAILDSRAAAYAQLGDFQQAVR